MTPAELAKDGVATEGLATERRIMGGVDILNAGRESLHMRRGG